MTRWFGRCLALLVAGLGVLAPAVPASAHTVLLRTTPAANVILDTAPTEVVMVFNEPVGIALGRLTVLAPDGKTVSRKPTQGKAATDVVIPLKEQIGKGTFLVSYRVISADGHPISGAYTFSVGTPSEPAAEPARGGSAPANSVVLGLLAAGKYAGYAGVALIAGSMLMLAALWPRRLPMTGPHRLAWFGWGLLFGGTLVSFLMQTPYSTGGTIADLAIADVLATGASTVGKAHIVRLSLLIASSTMLWRVTTGKTLGRADWILLAFFSVAMLLTWPFAGHSGQSPGKLLAIPADAIHVGSMAVWLGGLVVLARYLLPAAQPRELAAIMPVWSRWAIYSVVALAFTGTVQALLEVGTLDALFGTVYGQLVIAKVVGFAAILAVAAFARRFVQRTYVMPVAYALVEKADPQSGAEPSDAEGFAESVDDPVGVRRLRMRLVLEIALAAVVIGLATVLVQTSPGNNASAVDLPALPYSATVPTKKFILQIAVDPAQVGNNGVYVTAFTPDNKRVKVLEWTVTASLPSKGLSNLSVGVLPLTENHATGLVRLPLAGDWKFTFTMRTSDVDKTTVERTIRIS